MTTCATYTDAGEIASSKLDAWRWAVGNGIVNGTSGTTLSPASGTTRAQMSAILDRFFTYMMMQECVRPFSAVYSTL